MHTSVNPNPCRYTITPKSSLKPLSQSIPVTTFREAVTILTFSTTDYGLVFPVLELNGFIMNSLSRVHSISMVDGTGIVFLVAVRLPSDVFYFCVIISFLSIDKAFFFFPISVVLVPITVSANLFNK